MSEEFPLAEFWAGVSDCPDNGLARRFTSQCIVQEEEGDLANRRTIEHLGNSTVLSSPSLSASSVLAPSLRKTLLPMPKDKKTSVFEEKPTLFFRGEEPDGAGYTGGGCQLGHG